MTSAISKGCRRNTVRWPCVYPLHNKIKCLIPRGRLILTTFLNDGNPTTATATCIHKGCLLQKKIVMLFCDDRAGAVRPSHGRIHTWLSGSPRVSTLFCMEILRQPNGTERFFQYINHTTAVCYPQWWRELTCRLYDSGKSWNRVDIEKPHVPIYYEYIWLHWVSTLFDMMKCN